LGELSPKELRCTSFSDIIHKTSPQLQSRSVWVSIQFDNSDRRIPVEADTVTISREFRRGGEGIYRLNGRRVPRKQLTEILSSSDIQVTGYNLIPQHAVTRLAEVTADERRKIIEDMTGIGIYDLKKQEAQKQLDIADTNLRVASARTDEVRIRVESLEKERNDFLRYAFLNREIGRLEARILSRDLGKLRGELQQLQKEAGAVQERINETKRKREELTTRRNLLESKKRELEHEVVEKGSNELFQVERKIGDLNATITSLTTQIKSEQNNLGALKKQREATQYHLNQIRASLSQKREERNSLQRKHQVALTSLAQKQEQYEELSEKVRVTRQRLGENTAKIEEIEQQMEKVSKQLTNIETQITSKTARIELLDGQKQSLEARSTDYSRVIKDMSARLDDIRKLREEEESKVEASGWRIEQNELHLRTKEEEIAKAAEISKQARVSLAEFETQHELIEALSPEKFALKRIEEMASAGAIAGVYGTLQNLVKINEKCIRATEAASAGWMTALVVKDIETAMLCTEILKRTRLGRIKIIPAESVSPKAPIDDCSSLSGVLGPLVNFIECPDEVKPALNFVFGDTVLAEDQKTAFLASVEGMRAVVLTGDLYEPGGGMETGYFREPFDLTSIMPGPSAIENLDRTLRSLETLIEQGKAEIQILTDELSNLKQTEIEGRGAIERATRYMRETKENFEFAKKSLEATKSRIKAVSDEAEKEREALSQLRNLQSETREKLLQLQKERNSLKLSVKPSYLVQIENELLALTKSLNEMKQEQIHVEGGISSLEGSIGALAPGLDQARIQSRTLNQEVENTEKSVNDAKQALNLAQVDLEALTRRREALVSSVSAVRERLGEVDAEHTEIQEEIGRTYGEYESVGQAHSSLSESIREKEAQISIRLSKLRDLGYEESVEPVDEGARKTEAVLETLRKELASIGAVNQLAPQQYEEVIGNYKQLSVRIGELEREKLSIISFMNELDRKKHDAFMDSLNQVNKNFQHTFADITDGGSGRLVLENVEKPFEGGLEMLLQFPGKAELAVSSASGGEKSVATVCFLFALQSIHQLPFYIFDEIDAHLDALNSQRLAELLKSRSKGSQFVVISLRDTTISRANKVYGVFVQEGVSQIVSLPTAVVSN